MSEHKAILLSVHPKHVVKMFSGEKRLEFRRTWTKHPVSSIIVYATAPTQRIVATARIKKVHYGSPTALWELAKQLGGGLSRKELYEYFKGKKEGYAIELESISRIPLPVEGKKIMKNFRAPQSFSYVAPEILSNIEKGIKS